MVFPCPKELHGLVIDPILHRELQEWNEGGQEENAEPEISGWGGGTEKQA